MMDELRELYQEVILDHGKHPRNFRHPPEANHSAHGHNPLCGDRLTVYVTLDDHNRIQDAAFEGRGCAISVASASMMTDIVKGKTVPEVEVLFDDFHKMCTGTEVDNVPAEFEDDLEKLKVLSGVRQFPMRVKCATLAWHTLRAALQGGANASTE